ncbi:MAG: MFS transporter, partial [Propionibacteriaceae bacterium]|nr:MFS transporter [Propionibacteriaceae bacterium]
MTVGAACAVAQFTMTAAMTSAPLHLHRIGVSANAIGVIVSVHMVGMYAFAPVIAALNKRLSNGPRALMSLSMAVLAAALLSALLNASLAMVVIRLFFVGLGWSAIQLTTSLVFAAASETGSQRAVRTQGALDMVISLAGGLGIGFAGILQSAAEYHLT